MKLLNVEKQDNIEFYLSCKFQPSTFNVRCKTDVTDGMPDKQTNKQTNERMKHQRCNASGEFQLAAIARIYTMAYQHVHVSRNQASVTTCM